MNDPENDCLVISKNSWIFGIRCKKICSANFFFFLCRININNRHTMSGGSTQHFVTRPFSLKSFVAVSLKFITERNLLSFLCLFLIRMHSRVIRNDKIPYRNDHSFRAYIIKIQHPPRFNYSTRFIIFTIANKTQNYQERGGIERPVPVSLVAEHTTLQFYLLFPFAGWVKANTKANESP